VQVGRLMNRRASSDETAKELEAAARTRMKAEEKEKLRMAEEAKKLEAEMQAEKTKHTWGSRGVFQLVDEDFAVEDDESPEMKRSGVVPPQGGKPYPMSESKAEPKKVPPRPSSGWAPTGSAMGTKTESAKDIIAKTLEGLATPHVAAQSDGSTGLELALKLLSEQLTAERQRSASAEERAGAAEDKVAQLTRELLDHQAKAIERLERENERWSNLHAASK